MNNDKYKIQNPHTKYNPLTFGTINDPNNPNSIIYSNLSPIPSVQQFTHYQPQQSGCQSQSTIKSVDQQNSVLINSPNYAVYSSIGNEEEKILISKSELISFTQCFAHEKIQLENELKSLKAQNQLVIKQIQEIKEVNAQLQFTLKKSISHQPISQQIQILKTKLKLQFQKRMNAQKQFHVQQSIAFQFKKKIQFLEEKLIYQEEQLNRCQQLLKIKEDIIQNFEWEKTVTTARKQPNPQRSGRINTQNDERQVLTSKQNIVKNQSQSKNVNLKENSSLINNSHNFSQSINRFSQQTEVNQTLNLSEINFNHLNQHHQQYNQHKPNIKTPINPFEEVQKSTKQVAKYIIGNKSSQSNHGSKKKLNISLQKSSKNISLTNIDIPKNIQKQEQKGKLKSIVIKRNTSNQFSRTFEDYDRKDKVNGNQIQQKTKQLQSKLIQNQHHYVNIIAALQKQNSVLKNHLNELNKSNINLINESSLLKSISRDNPTSFSHEVQRKYNLMKQKCTLLQNQIQKTIKKYLLLQQQNNQLQKLMESLQNSQQTSDCKEYQQSCNDEQYVSKPEYSLKDMVTPQFRENKFNNNFFAKVKDENNCQKLFQNISLKQDNQQLSLLNTFEKKRIPQNTNILDNRNYLQLANNQMEDVSEIVCRNQEEMAIEDAFSI